MISIIKKRIEEAKADAKKGIQKPFWKRNIYDNIYNPVKPKKKNGKTEKIQIKPFKIIGWFFKMAFLLWIFLLAVSYLIKMF